VIEVAAAGYKRVHAAQHLGKQAATQRAVPHEQDGGLTVAVGCDEP
jgi:hypothetical protein